MKAGPESLVLLLLLQLLLLMVVVMELGVYFHVAVAVKGAGLPGVRVGVREVRDAVATVVMM